MDTTDNQVAAGIFVILLTVTTILIIIWLSSGFSFTGYTNYEVDMQESVSGLSEDAVVEFNGVSVGRVERVMISHKNPRLVELILSVKHDTPITQGTRAMLNVRGLTGISYISLKDKGENLAPIKILEGRRWPVIPTEPSLFLQMDAALGKLNTNFGKITKSLTELLNKKNLLYISNILKHVDKLSDDLVQNNRKLTKILNNTGQATNALPEILTNMNQMIENFSAMANEIKQNPGLLIRGKTQQIPGPGE